MIITWAWIFYEQHDYMLSIIFVYSEMSCKMKWEQKNDFKRHAIAYCWTLRIRDELNMKQEGFSMLMVGAEGASQVK